jgi:hypothetical protein
MEEVPSTRMGQQERTEAHPSTIPTGVPLPYTNLRLLAQILKTVMEGMTYSMTQVPLVIQIP